MSIFLGKISLLKLFFINSIYLKSIFHTFALAYAFLKQSNKTTYTCHYGISLFQEKKGSGKKFSIYRFILHNTLFIKSLKYRLDMAEICSMDKIQPTSTTGKASDSSITDHWLENRKNSYIVRWYVMVLPSCHRGKATGLEVELNRRMRAGEPLFEYFAPTYVEVKKKNGTFVETRHTLLYNYVVIHASESEIYRMKQYIPQYNFLPRVNEGGQSHYPYLSDHDMDNLRWIARSYSDVLPVCQPQPGCLRKGDKVRITEGQFKGAEATIVSQPGAGQKDIMACIDNWMWIPLLHVHPGQYEVIALNREGKHAYTSLDNERIADGLHLAMQHRYANEVTDEDRRLATEALNLFARLQMDTDVMRCKQYAILLQAHTILQHDDDCRSTLEAIQTLLPAVKAELSRALLLVTLYGCTDSSIYYEQAHRAVAAWKDETTPKKNKRRLLQQLADYDAWLNHHDKFKR